MSLDTILVAIVLIAGLYMAWNIGANDVANAIGTAVGSGALNLRQAVVMAAFLEFAGAFFFGSHVSETVQTGIVKVDDFASTPYLLVYGMLSSLIASGAWLQIASYYGWPVSTTHSIIGAIVGFGIVATGVDSIQWGNVAFIVSSWVVSPLIGGLLSFFIFSFLRRRVFYNVHPMAAAKALAPYLVMALVTMLSILVIGNGFKSLQIHTSFFHTLLLSLIVGCLAGLISWRLLQRIELIKAPARRRLPYGPEVALELDKAKKHLSVVQGTTTGELHYYVSLLMEEVDSISASLREPAEDSPEHSEYTAVERIFAYLQMVSAACMAFGHGANDVANAIGPVAAALGILREGHVYFGTDIPTWLLGAGGLGIVAGLATWGWRVIDTIGKKITELTPTRGFCAELAAATTIVVASRLGLPISTTHTLVGAVIGIAFARGIGALNLATTRDIVLSWIVTVPAGAVIAAGSFTIMRALWG